RAGKKGFVAFEQIKGRPSIAFRLDPRDVERLLMRKQFFETPYGRGQWVSLWADDALDWKAVTDLVDRSYRVVALKRMMATLGVARGVGSPASTDSRGAQSARKA